MSALRAALFNNEPARGVLTGLDLTMFVLKFVLKFALMAVGVYYISPTTNDSTAKRVENGSDRP